VWAAIDLALRFVYVALAPALLAIIAYVMPLTGLLITAGIATVVALIGSEAWHARVDRLPLVGRLLGSMANLADFYRDHPPKPLVYYILYPVLLPVIVFRRVPRREFFLYRRLNAILLVVVAAIGAYDYVRYWRPELTFGLFISSVIGVVIMQIIVAVVLIMPIVTTLVMLRQRGQVKTLSVLVVLAIATTSFGAYIAHKKNEIALLTWLRLQARTKYALAELADCERAHPDQIVSCLDTNPEIHALKEALVAAVEVARTAPNDVAAQLDAAHDKLVDYYKRDEADAFKLVSSQGAVVLYVRYPRKPPIWLGVSAKGFFIRPELLPAPLAKLLGLD